MEDLVLKSLAGKKGKEYNKDQLTKKILRGMRRFYRHHLKLNHTRAQMTSARIALPILDEFLHERFNSSLSEFQNLGKEKNGEYHYLIWCFCPKPVQIQLNYAQVPRIFITGYRQEAVHFLSTEVGKRFFLTPFFQIWRQFMDFKNSKGIDISAFENYIRAIENRLYKNNVTEPNENQDESEAYGSHDSSSQEFEEDPKFEELDPRFRPERGFSFGNTY